MKLFYTNSKDEFGYFGENMKADNNFLNEWWLGLHSQQPPIALDSPNETNDGLD